MLLCSRWELRRRWRSWLALAILTALGGGAVLALAAGARRAESAYPRLLRAEHAAEGLVFVDPGREALVRASPEVRDAASALGIPLAESDVVGVVLTDARFGRQINGFKYLAGRPVNPHRADEAVIGFLAAQSRHLHVGSTLTLHPLPSRQATVVHVVGIEAAPGEFPPRFASNRLPIYLGPAFLQTPAGAQAARGDGLTTEIAVRLRPGPGAGPAFLSTINHLPGGPAGFSALADQSPNVMRSMHLQAVTLWLMAAVVGAALTIVLAQLLTHQGMESALDYPTLGALGMTSGQLWLSAAGVILATAALGAAGAGALAWAGSPLLPLGSARIAEPDPGFAVDVVALGVGSLAVFLSVSLAGALAGLHARRAGQVDVNGELPRTAVGHALAALRLPLVMTMGSRLALQRGRGRAAIPVRATLAAAAVGVAAVAASMTFAASLRHLLATPALYGATFDAHLQVNGNFADIAPVVPALEQDPTVAGVAVAETTIPLVSGQVRFGALAQHTVKGSVDPAVIEGRLPTGPDEILLGTATLGALHAHIGQSILVAVEGITGPRPMRIVGRGVLATFDDTEQLGRGAVLTPEALEVFAGDAAPGFTKPPPGDALVSFQPGVAPVAGMAALQDRLGAADNITVTPPTEPTDVVNFGQVRDLPQVLSGLLAVMAAATVAYLLVTSIRRRRRDLAVLKTLGLLPRQVSAAIAWQATILILVAAAIGLPLGLAAGRSAWALVAGQIGVVVQPVVPWGPVLALLPGALVVANLVAAGPALAAGRIPPAVIFRSE